MCAACQPRSPTHSLPHLCLPAVPAALPLRPQDKSWRVRYNVAAQMVPLCEALGPDMTRAELVPAYTRLLEDSEAEVRIAAAGKVAAFSRMLTPQLIVAQVGV